MLPWPHENNIPRFQVCCQGGFISTKTSTANNVRRLECTCEDSGIDSRPVGSAPPDVSNGGNNYDDTQGVDDDGAALACVSQKCPTQFSACTVDVTGCALEMSVAMAQKDVPTSGNGGAKFNSLVGCMNSLCGDEFSDGDWPSSYDDYAIDGNDGPPISTSYDEEATSSNSAGGSSSSSDGAVNSHGTGFNYDDDEYGGGVGSVFACVTEKCSSLLNACASDVTGCALEMSVAMAQENVPTRGGGGKKFNSLVSCMYSKCVPDGFDESISEPCVEMCETCCTCPGWWVATLESSSSNDDDMSKSMKSALKTGANMAAGIIVVIIILVIACIGGCGPFTFFWMQIASFLTSRLRRHVVLLLRLSPPPAKCCHTHVKTVLPPAPHALETLGWHASTTAARVVGRPHCCGLIIFAAINKDTLDQRFHLFINLRAALLLSWPHVGRTHVSFGPCINPQWRASYVQAEIPKRTFTFGIQTPGHQRPQTVETELTSSKW
jgi:hypothetical protein